jgi:hypothetical protein
MLDGRDVVNDWFLFRGDVFWSEARPAIGSPEIVWHHCDVRDVACFYIYSTNVRTVEVCKR